MILTELFDKSYSFRSSGSSEDWSATFQTKDGSDVEVLLEKIPRTEIWALSFDRNGETEPTGEGDANSILATVIKALRRFAAESRPSIVVFTSRQVEGGRSNLYKRMVQAIKIPNYVNVSNPKDWTKLSKQNQAALKDMADDGAGENDFFAVAHESFIQKDES